MTGSKIMVVDDEQGIRELLSEVLVDNGFDVTSARDGQESLQFLKNSKFDLLITDINMPNLNGIELLKRMKTAGRKEKIVIMTGSPVDRSVVSGDVPQVYFQLIKPFKIKEFLRVVSSALKAEHQEIEADKKDRKCSLN
jgi:DNA-binding NtrC family response regulator